MTECPGCGRQMRATASICTGCLDDLVKALDNVAAYWVDLDVVRSRQTRYGSGGGRSAETPLAIDARFANGGKGELAVSATRNAVTTWCRYVLDHVATKPPADNVPACCRFLARWADWLRVSDVGGEVLADVTARESSLRRIVDRPPERWYAGKCGLSGCDAELYAKTETGTIRCPGCGHVWDLAVRRKVLLEHAETMLVTASEAARAVVAWADYDRGETPLVKRIGKWAERRRIEARGHVEIGGKERPLYLLGDILDLLADDLRHAGQSRSA